MKREVPGRPAPLDGTVEEPLLSIGFDHPDIVSFGVRGVSPGYVGRSGVAYASRSRLTTARARETAELIPRAGWTGLVFCAIATASCVLKSAADAFEHGYAPWIVTDTCASASDTGPPSTTPASSSPPSNRTGSNRHHRPRDRPTHRACRDPGAGIDPWPTRCTTPT
ncbi:isochorismatase family protein [Streptomyces sp. NPDC017868]|uniref:isochorismatase family protein n=1 Tax=Streptomyces sp. NPDC017868 TaxID=3365014 RepID=UPI003789D385